MDTAFIIGNGESRKIFPLEQLKDKGQIIGCNAIYRDHPELCHKIVCISPEMYEEVEQWKDKNNSTTHIIGPDDISSWNFVLDDDDPAHVPKGLKLYRTWQGGDAKRGIYKNRDFTESKGSGCSAVLHAAEQGFRNIFIIGFDILGARQWEKDDQSMSRIQNNMYKNTRNYPSRVSMKAYLKYEWFYHLTQTIRKFKNSNFYFINRMEYITNNLMLPHYFAYGGENVKAGIYADLKQWIDGRPDQIKWLLFHNNMIRRQS